jgi:tripartite-type tricarboxylate transporter receptor subunit TctC
MRQKQHKQVANISLTNRAGRVGLFVTAKTPKPIVNKLHAGVMQVLAMPDVKDRLEKLGAAAMPMQQDAFEKYLDSETASAAQLVKAAGIKIE